MDELLIQIAGASKVYRSPIGKRTILHDVNVSVMQGDRIALVGPNGSGKTTLLRIMLQVEPLQAGNIVVENSTDFRTAYVPQDYRNALFPWLRLRRNLSLALSGNGEYDAASTPAYTQLAHRFAVDLDLSKYPYQLSGGEQQIFVFIRAILMNPALLLLDEPFSSVDYARRLRIHTFLGTWVERQKCTLIFATHDFEEAVFLADRILLFDPRQASIQTALSVPFPWPRLPELKATSEFRQIVSSITAKVL